MSGSFVNFISDLAKEDNVKLLQSIGVPIIVDHLDQLSYHNIDSLSQTIKYANAMRFVQFGEGVKFLIRDSIINKEEMLYDGFTAKDVASTRNTYAHPERLDNRETFDFGYISSHHKSLLDRFNELLVQYPQNKNVQACIDALKHFTFDIQRISPTFIKDAENYLQILRGGYLEQLSETGKSILNSDTNLLCHKLTKRRDLLSHVYYEEGRTTAFLPPQEQAKITNVLGNQVKETNALNPDYKHKRHQRVLKVYKTEILGKRNEIELCSIARKWMTKDNADTPQKAFSVTGRLVANEISRLAKANVSMEHIRNLHNVLESSRKSQKELAKYLHATFPDGCLSNEVLSSLKRLNEEAQQDFWAHAKNKTGMFQDVMKKIELAFLEPAHNASTERQKRLLKGKASGRSRLNLDHAQSLHNNNVSQVRQEATMNKMRRPNSPQF